MPKPIEVEKVVTFPINNPDSATVRTGQGDNTITRIPVNPPKPVDNPKPVKLPKDNWASPG